MILNTMSVVICSERASIIRYISLNEKDVNNLRCQPEVIDPTRPANSEGAEY